MKRVTTIKTVMLLLVLWPVCAMAAGLGELRLSLITGDVQIKNIDTGEWAPAAINLPLKDGDQLWVPDQGRAEVESRRGSILRVDERSLLEVLRVDNDAMQFYLGMGRCYVNAKGEKGTTLQLDTPVSSLRVYERSKFSVDVAEQGNTEVSVFRGVITAENNKGATLVDAGNMLTLGTNSADLSPLSLADAWEEWNKDQDRALEEQGTSVRYLPEELDGYARDFDTNGEWVEIPDYGPVWRPTVHVTVGWSPYRHGRWVWIGDDYVWVAQEPWGWAPYHYGRWSYVKRHGWCWVPPPRHEVFWGPGYVGWVSTANTVSWVPLAPREIYYGHGHYGKYSEDIGHGRGHKVRGGKVYTNIYVTNSVTTIHQETFLRGKHVEVRDKGNPFLHKEEITVGRPEIKPERATKIAVIREIPKSEAPPPAVREGNVAERKGRRHLVKREDRSVFAPDKTPEAMPIDVSREPRPRVSRQGRRGGLAEKGLIPTANGEAKPAVGGRGQRSSGAPSALPGADQGEASALRTKGAASPPPAGGAPESAAPAEGKRKGRWQRPGKDALPTGQDQGVRGLDRQPTAPPSAGPETPSAPMGNVVTPAAAPPPEGKPKGRWQRPGRESLPSNQDQGVRGLDRQPTAPPSAVPETPSAPMGNVVAPEAASPPANKLKGRWQRPGKDALPAGQDQVGGRTDRQPPAPPAPGGEMGAQPANREVLSPPSPPPASRGDGRGQRFGREASPGQEGRGTPRGQQRLTPPPAPKEEVLPPPVERAVVPPQPSVPAPESRGRFRSAPPPAPEATPAGQNGREMGNEGRGRPLIRPQVAPPPPLEESVPIEGKRIRERQQPEAPAAQSPMGRALRGRGRQEMAPAVGGAEGGVPPAAVIKPGQRRKPSPTAADEEQKDEKEEQLPAPVGQ